MRERSVGILFSTRNSPDSCRFAFFFSVTSKLLQLQPTRISIFLFISHQRMASSSGYSYAILCMILGISLLFTQTSMETYACYFVPLALIGYELLLALSDLVYRTGNETFEIMRIIHDRYFLGFSLPYVSYPGGILHLAGFFRKTLFSLVWIGRQAYFSWFELLTSVVSIYMYLINNQVFNDATEIQEITPQVRNYRRSPLSSIQFHRIVSMCVCVIASTIQEYHCIQIIAIASG
ncbi:LOW QUALITY PROTEIN: hypothetical protein OSB04_un001590 [Centaurea solstitialis]|uniref:Uncharacterized protein n=1 Tax=Centaurea solstitialis TaxID=347529 RepID=A0AA38S3S9_9ASTR|nr:LOW QUALITY PROTEIN: hypothetical protein OSB04_un001590 [Centaurea solstitialis]